MVNRILDQQIIMEYIENITTVAATLTLASRQASVAALDTSCARSTLDSLAAVSIRSTLGWAR